MMDKYRINKSETAMGPLYRIEKKFLWLIWWPLSFSFDFDKKKVDDMLERLNNDE